MYNLLLLKKNIDFITNCIRVYKESKIKIVLFRFFTTNTFNSKMNRKDFCSDKNYYKGKKNKFDYFWKKNRISWKISVDYLSFFDVDWKRLMETKGILKPLY